MPPQNPQITFTDGNNNRIGGAWGLDPGRGLANEELRTGKAPVADILAHGAEGDGATNDTAPLKSAITAADANDGVAYLPPGTYAINDAITIPSGVTLRGAGSANTRIKTTNNNAQITFHLESHAELKGFTLDQNIQNRTYVKSTGVMISGGKNDCVIEDVPLDNVSTGGEGVGIYLDADETDPQDTYNNRISNCHIVGGWQDGANSGDFLIRGRTSFNKTLEDDQFTVFLRDNLIENCTFSGEGKAAIEWVGPATRHNLSVGCTARDFTTCTGIFESSLGAKHNTFAYCTIADCFADSTAIGFYSDGYSTTGVPERRSEDDLFLGCRVRNFREISGGGSDVRAFRVRRGDRVSFKDCFIDGVSTPSGSTGNGIGVNVNHADDASLSGMTIRNTDIDVEAASNTRPRWDDVIGAGPFGGVDLSTTTGRQVGDKAMSGDHYTARWTGTQWRRSDGTLI